jgi:hypothetical protein
MLLKVVSRSGKELVPGGLETNVRSCAALALLRALRNALATSRPRAPLTRVALCTRAGQLRGRPEEGVPRRVQSEEGK